MPIRVLPPEIACRIAAGEVITRPADVVKELIENAVDAIVEARRLGHAAGSIEVEIAGGGLRTLRVADDGCGIPPDEVPLAFARHATSKVRSLDDLLEVRTLGFRGEALASIAAVAEVTLSTATHRHPAGVVVTVREGAVVDRRRKGRTPGTSVTVRRLFHNVPARLKFLRAPHVESALIGHTVRRYALAYPDIRMTLSVEGQPLFRSRGGPSIREALEDVYGAEVAARLRPLGPISVARVRLAGWIGPPEISRPGKTHVTWLVNGRSAVPRGLVE
ncbi:MAG TPA: DNA mismatch repair endonuclease MutL, partial [Chloroflexota bacterium]